MTYGTLGTISHGTLRSEDLLETFADELARLNRGSEKSPGAAALIAEARETRECLENDPDCVDVDIREAASEVIAELIDALHEFAPPFCYFGAHEGDGSDFGFWPSMEAVSDAVYSGDAMQVNAGDDILPALAEHVRKHSELPSYAVSVTDHGNVTVSTLESVDLAEVWSIV